MKTEDYVGIYASAFNKAGMERATPVQKERRALQAVANAALEEAARLFENAKGEPSDSGRWGQEFDAKLASSDIRALKVSAE